MTLFPAGAIDGGVYWLQQLPKLSPAPVIGELIPFCPVWPDQELSQLTLDRYETGKFEEYGGLRQNIIMVNSVGKTALHGWSNQLDACPCECRSHPLSDKRLQSKGLFGALLPVPGLVNTHFGELPATRHLHPWELSLINGMNPNMPWGKRLRLGIAAVGQLASPVQSCWIAAQVWMYRAQVLDLPFQHPAHCLWNHFTAMYRGVEQSQPCIAKHPNFVGYFARVHACLSDFFQASLGPNQNAVPQIEAADKCETWQGTDVGSGHPEHFKHPVGSFVHSPAVSGASQKHGTSFTKPSALASKDEVSVGPTPTGPAFHEKNINSQRTGRKDPEEHKQPPSRTEGLVPDPDTPCPGIQATPGYSNACPSKRPPDEEHLKGPSSKVAKSAEINHQKLHASTSSASEPHQCPGMQATPGDPNACPFSCPGIQATPGYHNAWEGNQPSAGEPALSPPPNIEMQAPKTEPISQCGGIKAFATGEAHLAIANPPIEEPPKPFVMDQSPSNEDHAKSNSVGPSLPTHEETVGARDQQEVTVTQALEHWAHQQDLQEGGNGTEAVDSGPTKPGSEPSLDQSALQSTELAGRDDVENHAVLFNTKGHIIQVIRPGETAPLHIRVPDDATVGSIAVAESKIGTFQQPVRSNTCVGTMIRGSDTTRQMQQIFLQEMPGCGNRHSCDKGFMPPLLFSDEPHTRLQVLYSQEAWVATDEMEFYLAMIQTTGAATKGPIMTMPEPVLDEDIEPMLQRWMSQLAPFDAKPGVVISALWVAQHWYPVVLVLHEGDIQVFTTPGGHDWVLIATRALGPHITIHTAPRGSVFNNDCGFQTIGWITQAVFDKEFGQQGFHHTPLTVQDAITWRTLFEHHLYANGGHDVAIIPNTMQFGGAANGDLHEQLCTLLTDRGVPKDAVHDRANVILDKLGRQPVGRAFRLSDPWRELKHVANQQIPKLQLVLPSELQAVIQLRAQQDKPIGSKQKKTKNAKQDKKPLQLGADDVSVPHGIFIDGAKQSLAQIPFGSIGAAANGIAVVSALQAVPYLRITQPISQKALALVVVDYHTPILNGIGEEVRFPAKCERTGEAIILTAKMLQLGSDQVKRATPDAQVKVEEVVNQVLRTVSYRDELMHPEWKSFVTKPVKHVIEDVPCLQQIDGHSPIIDVWDRQFLNEKLEKSNPVKPHFSVLVSELRDPTSNKSSSRQGRKAITLSQELRMEGPLTLTTE